MASTASRLSYPISAAAAASARRVRRHITPEAGRALEKLGHAIEYLTDEAVRRGGEMSSHVDDLEAIQLLMKLNRTVYFECPAVPALGDRLRAAFRRLYS